MLTESNKIIGHKISEEAIQEILLYLGQHNEDLRLKFIDLLRRVEELQCNLDSTWNSYIKTLKDKK